jgi:hypothetical protein
MAKVLAIGPDDIGDLHLLLPASVVAVSSYERAHVALTLVSGQIIVTTLSMEAVTNWLGWTDAKDGDVTE